MLDLQSKILRRVTKTNNNKPRQFYAFRSLSMSVIKVYSYIMYGAWLCLLTWHGIVSLHFLLRLHNRRRKATREKKHEDKLDFE